MAGILGTSKFHEISYVGFLTKPTIHQYIPCISLSKILLWRPHLAKQKTWWRNMRAGKNDKTLHFSGQFIINPYPELFKPFWVGFPYYSPLFGVTSAEVVINCPEKACDLSSWPEQPHQTTWIPIFPPQLVLLKHWSRRERVLSFSKYDLSCKGREASTKGTPETWRIIPGPCN